MGRYGILRSGDMVALSCLFAGKVREFSLGGTALNILA